MNHLLQVLGCGHAQREALHLHTLLPFAMPQVTRFSYRSITSIVEIFQSTWSRSFCRLHADVRFCLLRRPLKLLSIYNLDAVAMPTTRGELLDMAVLWPLCRGGQLSRSVAQGNWSLVLTKLQHWILPVESLFILARMEVCKWKGRTRLCFMFNICFIAAMIALLCNRVGKYLLEKSMV